MKKQPKTKVVKKDIIKAPKQATIEILGRDDKALLRNGVERAARGKVPLEKLRTEIQNLTGGLAATLSEIARVGTFELEEVVFKVEISASGNLTLLGTGVGIDTSGAIELKFCRPKP